MTPSSDSKNPRRTGKSATERGRSERSRPSRPARETAGEERGIFSSLPSTRPQRPSARRAAAKRAAAAAAASPGPSTRSTAAKGRAVRSASAKAADSAPQPTRRDVEPTGSPIEPTSPSSKARAKPKPAGRRRTAAGRVKPIPAERVSASPPLEPPVPPQGFEGEGEIEPGTPIQPPSRPEVAGALAELVGDLAQTGLARGGRLVKEALGRLPGI